MWAIVNLILCNCKVMGFFIHIVGICAVLSTFYTYCAFYEQFG